MNVVGSILNLIKPKEDDLGSDRMNYFYTTVIITFVSITITMKQQVGNPLQCWVPHQFGKPWEQYAENYCFVYNTYWVNPDERVPTSVQERVAKQLIYYQWVSFIMGLEALFFYLPSAVWGALYRKSGINILAMTKAAMEAENAADETARMKKLGIIQMHFDEYVRLNQARRKYNPTMMKRIAKFGLVDGCFISNSYLFIKCLYMLNLIGQFLMQNQFLGQHNHLWGATILNDIISGSNWEDTGNFPRIAMCDFEVRVLGNFQRYSVQCVLVLNMFNEKIFLFLYWWFIVVFVFTLTDTIQMAIRTRAPGKKEQFIRKFMKVSLKDDDLLIEFCKRKINADIVILLQIISNHSSDIVTTEIIDIMWKDHKENFLRKEAVESGIITNCDGKFDLEESSDEENSQKTNIPNKNNRKFIP
ncbi:unnamed protein product, partial [Mesorhabditis belari]|uniref:Innexin n=1 Tax=Mesorhabditis belari TaxID=2138241 RepID=A0AAF3ETE5_9BILA